MEEVGLAGSAWDREAGPDVRFWNAWRVWKAKDDAWQADTGSDEDARFARHNDGWEQAFTEMMAAPVTTAYSLRAKMGSDPGLAQDLSKRGGWLRNSYEAIIWDLERMAMRELPSREPTDEERALWRKHGREWFESLPTNM